MNKRDEQAQRNFPVCFVLFVLLVMAGMTDCARFEPKPLSPSASAERLENRSLTNDSLRTFLEKNLSREMPAWPPASWNFKMLTLVAWYWHPSLELARAQWAVAHAGEQTAGQRPNPTLNVTPGYNSTTPMASPWFPLGSLDVPLETAGKRGHRRAHAAHLADTARLTVATVAWQVRATLRSHLLEFEAATQRENLIKQQFTLQEKIVKALEQQAKAGAVAGSELLPRRISWMKLQLELADTERLRTEVRARVAEDVGISVRALSQIEFSFPLETGEALSEAALGQFRRSALQSRADILGALSEYAAAQSALQLEIAKQYPDVHLQPGYQFDQGDNKWSLGLIMELPILNQNQGPIAEARAHREEAAARFNALQAKVLAEIDRATDALRLARQNVSTLQSLAAAQEHRREAVAGQFKAGAIDQLELLTAESEHVAAQLVQVEAQVRFQQAIGAMEDALQIGINLPVESLPGNEH